MRRPRIIKKDWLVVIGIRQEHVAVEPDDATHLEATIHTLGEHFHRMRREPNHVLSAFPDCTPPIVDEFGFTPGQFLAVPARVAKKVAKPCIDCFEKRGVNPDRPPAPKEANDG